MQRKIDAKQHAESGCFESQQKKKKGKDLKIY